MRFRIPVGILAVLAAALIGWRIARSRSAIGSEGIPRSRHVLETLPSDASPAPIRKEVPPEPTVRAEEDSTSQEERFRRSLALSLDRHRRVKDPPPSAAGRFSMETALHLLEARLLAMAYPDLMESACITLLSDPSTDSADVEFAFWALSTLASQGRSQTDAFLHRLAVGNNSERAGVAIDLLSWNDVRGTCRSLYTQGCRAGIEEAFQALARYPDGETGPLMREILQGGGPVPLTAGIRLLAKNVLEKQSILTGPDRDARLITLLQSGNANEVRWAIAAGRSVALPGIAETLREKLDRLESECRSRFDDLQGRLPPGTSWAGFDDQFSHSPKMPGMSDLHFDFLLTTLSDLGGALTPLESRRLTHFGWIGDPRVRLNEVLKEDP